MPKTASTHLVAAVILTPLGGLCTAERLQCKVRGAHSDVSPAPALMTYCITGGTPDLVASRVVRIQDCPSSQVRGEMLSRTTKDDSGARAYDGRNGGRDHDAVAVALMHSLFKEKAPL